MKKYIRNLFAFLFVVSLFGSNFSYAQVGGDPDPDPTQAECINLEYNMRYRMRDANTNGQVSVLQDFLQARGYLNSEPTGFFGLLTFRAVKSFQNANGIIPASGYVGPITRAKIKHLTCDEEEIISNGNVIISGVSGPQSLSVGQQGTWSITASSLNGADLAYAVVWGDETYNQPFTSAVQQTAAFTHTYNRSGTYKIIFTVTSANTIQCITTPCPSNAGSAQASISVRVRNANSTSSITVYSPSQNDIWNIGNSYEIRWSPNPSMSILPSKVTITLNHQYPTCLDSVPACMIAQIAPYVIAENINDTGSYKFTVPFNLPDYYHGTMQVTVTRDHPQSLGRSNLFTINKIFPTPICEYAAPSQGCSYVPGPNYNPNTQCGLVISCSPGQ
jgi:peptidoglycan hydrolase-like protein with peptidoglycan-binding domain